MQLPVWVWRVRRVSQQAQECFLHEGSGMSLSQETSTSQSPWARRPFLLGRESGQGPAGLPGGSPVAPSMIDLPGLRLPEWPHDARLTSLGPSALWSL